MEGRLLEAEMRRHREDTTDYKDRAPSHKCLNHLVNLENWKHVEMILCSMYGVK